MRQALAHQRGISRCQTQAEAGQNEALRTFAQDMLPVLEQHLQRVQELMQDAGADQ